MEKILQAVGEHASLHEILENYERFKSEPEASKFAVIKIGGALLADPKSERDYYQRELLGDDLAALAQVGLYPTIVHGAGPQLDKRLANVGIETPKTNGIRHTPKAAAKTLDHTARGVGFRLVALINIKHKKASAYIPPQHGTLIGSLNDPNNIASVTELAVNPDYINQTASSGKIPILSSVGKLYNPGQMPSRDRYELYDQFEPININADVAAGAIAVRLSVHKYISLTETGAVLDVNSNPISQLSIDEASAMIQRGEIKEGMIPKVQEAINLITQGIGNVAITSPRNLLVELFTDTGRGTLIKP